MQGAGTHTIFTTNGMKKKSHLKNSTNDYKAACAIQNVKQIEKRKVYHNMSFTHEDKMQTVIVAFDVDGTLIRNTNPNRVHGVPENDDVPNVEVINLLMLLSKFKNIKIVVWSGGGEQYAQTWVNRLSLNKYVWKVTGKVGAQIPKPDIAIDDIQACKLGVLNLIVRQK